MVGRPREFDEEQVLDSARTKTATGCDDAYNDGCVSVGKSPAMLTDLITLAIMGFMGAYWATSTDIERFDVTLFRRQVATFVQLTGELMTADLSEVATAK